MAFFQDVSPYFQHTGSTAHEGIFEFTTLFQRFLHCLLLYACFHTVLTLCHPYHTLLIKIRLGLGLHWSSTMAHHWGLARYAPMEIVLSWRYLQHYLVTLILADMLYHGLVPRTHRERRVQAYATRLCHKSTPRIYKLLLCGLLTLLALAHGLTIKWGSHHPVCWTSQSNRPTRLKRYK